MWINSKIVWLSVFSLVIVVLATTTVVLGAVGIEPASISVTRGGVVSSGDPVTGSFTVNITNSSGGTVDPQYTMGFTVNPMNMTGGFCDRPPAIYDNKSSSIIRFDPLGVPTDYRPIGFTLVQEKTNENNYHGSNFFQLSPNGVKYPSDNPAIVYKWGTQYNARATLTSVLPGLPEAIPVIINTSFADEPTGWEMSLKPGTYNFHVQKFPYDYNDEPADLPVTVSFGTVDISITQKYQNIFKITGKNTDSKKTYLWLTGDGLPDCGANLTYGYLQPVPGVPEVLYNGTLFGSPGSDKTPGPGYYYEDGTFSVDWRIPPTIKQGNYTLWASSVNPSELSDVLEETWASYAGVCGLGCDICAPSDKAEFTIGTWGMGEPVIENGTISLDCCNHNLCTTCPDYPRMILRGQLNIEGTSSGYPLQVWIFGDDKVGDKPLLFSNSFTTFSDDQSSYEIDITRLLLDNGITVCDLENGDYNIVVQSKGLENGKMHPVFDITHERAISFDGLPVFDWNHWYVVTSHPYSKFPIGMWTSWTVDGYGYPDFPIEGADNPGWIPLFAVEGPGAMHGTKALNALKTALNQEFIHDQYKVVTFTVDNKLCREAVDFIGTPVKGEAPLKVSFTDISSYTGTEYFWDFGDGINSTEEHPSHTYQKPGQYDVSLTIKDGTDYRIRNKYEYINVNSKDDSILAAEFTADQTVGAYPLTVQFIDQSTGGPVAWNWNFGDDGSSSLQSPRHIYRSPRSYSVNLEIFDKNGNVANTTKDGFIKVDSSSLRAAFRYTFPDEINFTKIQFTDLSEGTGINKWGWNFGDGTSSNEQNPLHAYLSKGCYPVSLKVENDITNAIRSYQICI